jgi:hypothetical protein
VLRVLATGNPALRESAAARVVLAATIVGGSRWRDAQRAKLAEADAISKLHPTSEQFEEQLNMFQLEELKRLYRLLSALGGEAPADYAFSEATNSTLSLERRLLALELAENLQRAGARRHADQLSALSAELRQPQQ